MKQPRGGKRGLLLLTFAFVLTAEDEHFKSSNTQDCLSGNLIEDESFSSSSVYTSSVTSKQVQKDGCRSSAAQDRHLLDSNEEIKLKNPTHTVRPFASVTDLVDTAPLLSVVPSDSEEMNSDRQDEVLPSQKSQNIVSSRADNNAILPWDHLKEMLIDDGTMLQSNAQSSTTAKVSKIKESDTHRSEDVELQATMVTTQESTFPDKIDMHPSTSEKEVITYDSTSSISDDDKQIYIDSIELVEQSGNEDMVEMANELEPIDLDRGEKEGLNSSNKKDEVAERLSTVISGSAKNVDAVMEVDFASNAAGALILEKSKNFQGTSNLLNDDNDRYAIVPCKESTKFVVIGLSEDILVKSVVLANFERFSSHTKEFRIVGRSTTVGEWTDMGTYSAERMQNQQTFHLHKPIWARYVKIIFLTHHGNEDYCTISQISVHGSTMLQGFHEQWGEEEDKGADRNSNIQTNTAQSHGSQDAVVLDHNSKTKDDSLTTHPSNGVAKKAANASIQYQNDLSSLSVSRHWEDPNFRLNVCLNPYVDEIDKQIFILSLANGSVSPLETSRSASSHMSTNNSCDTSSLEHDSCISVVDKSRGDDTGWIAGGSTSTSTDESGVVVKRIKNLIRTTAGAVDEIGNTIRQRASAAVEIVQHHQPQQSVSETTGDGEIDANDNRSVDSTKKEFMPLDMPEAEKDEALAAKKVSQAKQLSASTERKTDTPDKKSAVFETDHEARSSTEAIQEKPLDGINDTGLGKALQRFPSARCLEKLDFAKFKKSVLSARSGGAGAQSSGAPGSSMEPIFKKLTDEIKALQSNMVVHDQYAKETLMCYQSIILELIITMEVTQINHSKRIMQLEEPFQPGYGTDLKQIYAFCTNSVRFVASKTIPYIEDALFWLLFGYKCLVYILFDRQSILSSILRFFLGIVAFFLFLYKVGLRIVWTQATNDNRENLDAPSILQQLHKEDLRYATSVEDKTSIPSVVTYVRNYDAEQSDLNDNSDEKTLAQSAMAPDRYNGAQETKAQKEIKSSILSSPSTPVSTDSA